MNMRTFSVLTGALSLVCVTAVSAGQSKPAAGAKSAAAAAAGFAPAAGFDCSADTPVTQKSDSTPVSIEKVRMFMAPSLP